MRSRNAIMKDMLSLMIEHYGAAETEYFINTLLREQIDYTEWHDLYFGSIPDEELDREIDEFVKNNPDTDFEKSIAI